MEQYNQQVYQIRKELFDGRWKAGMDATIILLTKLLQDTALDQTKIQELAKMTMAAMENKDYLLLADLIYFEFPPLWQGTTSDIDAYIKTDNPELKIEKFVFKRGEDN